MLSTCRPTRARSAPERVTARALAVAAVAAVALALAGASAPSADAGKARLLVLGDSLAFDSEPYLLRALPRWRIVDEIWFARRTGEGPAILRRYGRRLPRTIHVSLGTADDPTAVDQLRRDVRRTMRIAGRRRCVVWANVWRPVPSGPGFDNFNVMLADEDAHRPNLRVLDWHSMVAAHNEWLKKDGVHVNADGNRARARAVRREIRACRAELAA